MKNRSYYLLLLLPLFTSCASMYIPSPVNTPLFEDKGEVLVEAGVSTNGIFATTSYSFSKKYALIANGNLSFGNFAKFSDIGDLSSGGEASLGLGGGGDCAHSSVELGIGRYNIVNVSGWHLEVFTGARCGKANNLDREVSTFDSWHLQGFVQANFGRRVKYKEIGFASRIDYSYFNTKDVYKKKNEVTYENFSALDLQQFVFFRLGGERLKVVIRIGFNFALSFPPKHLYYNNNIWDPLYTIFHHSVGLTYRFGNKQSKHKKIDADSELMNSEE